jgi:hypothetical protein
MPSIKKAEYETLKAAARHYKSLAKQCDEYYKEIVSLQSELNLFQSRLKTSEQCRNNLVEAQVKQLKLHEADIQIEKFNYKFVFKALCDQTWETERWKRYYQAAIKTFKVQEYVEMPGCFNPMESIEYVVKQQEEDKDVVNRSGC